MIFPYSPTLSAPYPLGYRLKKNHNRATHPSTYIYIYVLAAKPLTFQESNKHIELVSNQPKLKRINANGPMGPPLVPSAMPNHLVHSSGHCQSTQPSCAWQRHGESPSQAPFPSSLSDFPQVFCRKYIGTLRLRRYLHIIFQDL